MSDSGSRALRDVGAGVDPALSRRDMGRVSRVEGGGRKARPYDGREFGRARRLEPRFSNLIDSSLE